MINEWKTIEKGYLGNLLVEKKFIEHGFNLFKPVLENGKVDLIVEKNNKYLKIQIKTVITDRKKKLIPVRKISHNMGEYKIKRYTKDDIDFFIGADLENEDLYILPISFSSKYSNCISINSCQQYKNNFNQLEPLCGNMQSGEDDNVETLTDNADGNDVGTEINSGRERLDNPLPKRNDSHGKDIVH